MSLASCFWALLSLENFEFIYLPSFVTDVKIAFGKSAADILINHSLLDFIHPEELSLAKTDLLNFVRVKTLAGAVTRCRLHSIKSMVYREYGSTSTINLQKWIITDVVMYTATNKTILTFFHTLKKTENDTTSYENPCCGSEQLYLNESNVILNKLQQYSLPMTIDDPFRIFQIYDTHTKQLLISWPNSDSNVLYYSGPVFMEGLFELVNNITVREMDRRVQNPQLKSDAACTLHTHSNSTTVLKPYGLVQVERIIITYGSLTFGSFQITIVKDQRCISSYHHYMYCTPSSTADQYNMIWQNKSTTSTPTLRKSNINNILNNTTTVTDTIPIQHHIPHHDSRKNYNNNNDNNINEIDLNEDTSRSPLPRAWRGRFGAYEKKCENCQTNTSPEWRRGPSGHKTLCNACGLRYARLVAKQERQQPKEDDTSPPNTTTLLGSNSTSSSSSSKFKTFKSKKQP